MDALNERKQIDLYVYDIIRVMAQKSIALDSPMPSDLWFGRVNRDRRSSEQIKQDLLAALGGG